MRPASSFIVFADGAAIMVSRGSTPITRYSSYPAVSSERTNTPTACAPLCSDSSCAGGPTMPWYCTVHRSSGGRRRAGSCRKRIVENGS